MASARLTETTGANITVNGGTFLHVEGNATHIINPPVADERGLDILLQGIARDAMHDSAERFPPPKCHPNTRVVIQKEIQDWVNSPSPAHSVFWLRASAGEGKSAIMQSIAQLLSSPDGNIVATFFFGRGKGNRADGKYLFSTLAYQLAVNIPGLRPHIDQIMRHRPTLPSSSMDFQVRFLFVEAFMRLGPVPSIPWTILIDGLDEYWVEENQQSILNLIGEITTVHCLPLRFLIASRPEPHISQVFDGPILHGITFRKTISDHFESNSDVEKFLRDSFADIYQRKAHLFGNIDGRTWPSEDAIELLVTRSSRQFIYASTAIKFIDQRFCHPGKQLNILLSSHSSDGAMLSDVDSLYKQILSIYPDFKDLKPILGFIIVMSEPIAAVIEDLLQLQHGELEMILQGLHSVLSWTESPALANLEGSSIQPLERPEMDESEGSWTYFMREITISCSNAIFFRPKYGTIDISHASFVDFLVNRGRAGNYFIDSSEMDSRIIVAGFSLMSNFILSSMRGNSRRPFSIRTVLHMGRVLYTNLARLPALPQSILDGISKIEDEFEKMSLASNMPIPVESFVGIHLLIMHAMRHIKVCSTDNIRPSESRRQLSHIHRRYLRILYLLCEKMLFTKGRPLSEIPGIFAIRYDLSSGALAYLFEIDQGTIERHWKTLGIDLQLDGPSLLDKCLEDLPIMDPSLEDNEQICKRIQFRHLALCSTVVLRLLSRSWAETPEPHRNVQKFIDGQFMLNLDGLTLAPLEFNSVLTFLDVLGGLRIHYSDIGTSSFFKLSCIWTLVKRILAWLAKIDKLGHTSSAFSQRVRYTFDRFSQQIFCVVQNARGENEITIREPFLGIEKYLLKKDSFYWFSREFGLSYEPVLISNDQHLSGLDCQITEDQGQVMLLSVDLFLVDFSELNLGSYLTDIHWARNLHLPPDKLYSSIFAILCKIISKSNDFHDRIHDTKKKMLLKTCIGYLQKECVCDSLLKEGGALEDETLPCQALEWSQYILAALPGRYSFVQERHKLEEIIANH